MSDSEVVYTEDPNVMFDKEEYDDIKVKIKKHIDNMNR